MLASGSDWTRANAGPSRRVPEPSRGPELPRPPLQSGAAGRKNSSHCLGPVGSTQQKLAEQGPRVELGKGAPRTAISPVTQHISCQLLG